MIISTLQGTFFFLKKETEQQGANENESHYLFSTFHNKITQSAKTVLDSF